MAPLFRFYDLGVWRKSIEYAKAVYALTATFPGSELYGLTSQLRRASISISSNIAEGSGRQTRTDFARYVGIAYGSLMETVSQLYLAKELGFVKETDFESIANAADELSRMLSGLQKSLRS